MRERVTVIHDRYEHGMDASFDALDHLIRDIGPEAAKNGGDLFLLATQSMARGATLGGQLTG
jgi:hypothetical protein